MNIKLKQIIIAVVIVMGIAAIAGGYFFPINQNKSEEGDKGGGGKLDSFAKCLGEKGAIFYGAFWCPHCQNQKAMFGGSAKLLPYVECSTPDRKGQLDVCKEKQIEGYPTWIYADGTRESGEIPLARLAEKIG